MDKKKIQGLVATGIVSAGMINQIPMTSLAVGRREIDNNSRVTATQTMEEYKKIEAHIPDPNLRRVLNTEYLGQTADAPITIYQLRNLKVTLYLGSKNITDLTGLEYCEGITGLDLRYNQIIDLTPIKNLKHLKILRVTEQNITVNRSEFNKEKMIKNIDGKFVTLTPTGDDTYKFNAKVRYSGGKYDTTFSGTVTVTDATQSTKPTTTPSTSVTTPTQSTTPVKPVEQTQQTAQGTQNKGTGTSGDAIDVGQEGTIDNSPIIIQGPTDDTPQIASKPDDKETVNIPDESLKRALNTELGQKADAKITRGQLRNLTGTLYLGDSNISNLIGLEYCENIDGLYLGMNNIKDLTPLQTLKKLTYLDAIDQNITVDKFSPDMVKGVDGKYVELYPTGDNTYSFYTVTPYGDGSYTAQFSGQIIVTNDTQTEPSIPVTPQNPQVDQNITQTQPTEQGTQNTAPTKPTDQDTSNTAPTKPTVSGTTTSTPSKKPTVASATVDKQGNVNIKDYALRRALNDRLGQNPNAQITKAQLEGLTGMLYLAGENISDLSGLEYCTNIDGLYLGNNKIKDLSILNNLNKLTYLDATNQNITVTRGEFNKQMIKDVNGNTVELYKESDKQYSFYTQITYGEGNSFTGYFSGNIYIQ